MLWSWKGDARSWKQERLYSIFWLQGGRLFLRGYVLDMGVNSSNYGTIPQWQLNNIFPKNVTAYLIGYPTRNANRYFLPYTSPQYEKLPRADLTSKQVVFKHSRFQTVKPTLDLVSITENKQGSHVVCITFQLLNVSSTINVWRHKGDRRCIARSL